MAFWVGLYFRRKRLVRLGYVDSLGDLDCLTADYLLTVDQAVETVADEKMKAQAGSPKPASSPKGRGRRR